ncbi:MAG TPA: hypothetical protein VHP33_10660 [Polyangiaceae bacterium]|nr:hypothetical protein [Polyangiaceae bacterium]
MSWSKMGRWLLVGIVTAVGASACGGRGNLPSGELVGDPFGGTTSFAGTSSVAGVTATAGTVASGGASAVGGSASTAGTFGVAGTPSVAGTTGIGGTGSVCMPGSAFCEGNSVALCVGPGNGYAIMDCGRDQRCTDLGGKAYCQSLVCKAGTMQCDASGRYVQTCGADGLTLVSTVDCGARGQRCQDASCRSLVCQPNQLFCDKTGVRLCNADGSGSTAWQTCGANQYCDPLQFVCQQGICAPGQPACNGSVATYCNANGSGYVAMGIDCGSQPDRQCVAGACLCPPTLADCDGSAKTGCEANVSSDPDNCTGCGIACSSNNMAKRTCDDSCDGTCTDGYQDCNGDKLKDGCETGTSNDVKNCGGCGLACSSNHVAASCASGVCNGACTANFNDCNGSKLKDGCESDSRTDSKNCGGCGLACSTNHVKPTCAAGTCGGACESGFSDCNGNKQTDGCEINTNSDPKNCGGCGIVCPADQSCGAGKCGGLLTFTGIQQNLPVSSLTGWTQCFSETYGQSSTDLGTVQKLCQGSLLMLACRPVGSPNLQLAAYAARADVLYDTGFGNDVHNANGVGWYYSGDQSWGFAPLGLSIVRNSCDTQDSSIVRDGGGGDQRLCWHTGGSYLQGGWRCGYNDTLNASFDYERLIFTAP